MLKLGTTLSPIGKKALLCGSGELGKEVAIELQRYGIEVVALDRYNNAPARQWWQVVHGCRQLVSWDVGLSPATSATPIFSSQQFGWAL